MADRSVVSPAVSEKDDFNALSKQAHKLRVAGRTAEALALFEKASRAKGGSDFDRLSVTLSISECCLFLGETLRAIELQRELYRECVHRPAFQEIAFRGLFLLVHSAVQHHWGEFSPAQGKGLLKLVDNGLRWLKEIGKEKWRPALLRVRSQVFEEMKNIKGALADSEEAFRGAKEFHPPGFLPGFYAAAISRYARLLGNFQRAAEVLAEVENLSTDPIELYSILLERARLLRALGKDRAVDALETARQLRQLADEIESPVDKVLAYGELAVCAAKARSPFETTPALTLLLSVALDNHGGVRGRLLHDTHTYLNLVSTELESTKTAQATVLKANILAWKAEVEAATKALPPQQAVEL